MFRYIRNITAKNDEGASAVEYGLLVAAIAAVIVIIVFALGTWVKKSFDDTCKSISGSGTPAATCDKAP